MGLITKSDLKNNYSWTAIPGDDPRITGEPDSTLLNRGEGYEILYFINKFADIHDFKNKSSALKIEKMIHDAPSDMRSQSDIKKWIEDNWKNY